MDYVGKSYANLNNFRDVLVMFGQNLMVENLSRNYSIYWINVKHLVDAGMYPWIVSSLILPKIISNETNQHLKAITQAAHEYRERRIEIFKRRKLTAIAALKREIETEPHVNWKLSDYPGWLLLEIEQNICIRYIQIEVAKSMIEPPEIAIKHSMMQLNMGEGWTAVIVSILATLLGNGEQGCEITVLKSLFATNSKSLRQC